MLRNFRISTRLFIGFALTLLLTVSLGVTAIIEAGKIRNAVNDITSRWLPGVQILGEMEAKANEVRRSSLRAIMESNREKKAIQFDQNKASLKNYNEAFVLYKSHVNSPAEQAIANKIESAWQAYLVFNTQTLELASAGESRLDEARTLSVGSAAGSFKDAMAAIREAIEVDRRGADAAATAADHSYVAAVNITASVIVVSVVLSIVIAKIISRSVTAPLAKAVQIASTVATGDLTAEIRSEGRDEISGLLDTLGSMTTSLREIIGNVRASSESIALGASQIAAGNADLSQRTEEQAASLGQTASSMEEITATVKQNAENATQGNLLALSAAEVARRGGDVVKEVIEKMENISQSSLRISDIITVIEGIAFQTNILALNAAVEAARAGEQGRGFAVVAGEVRSLAQRSAGAAKEITELIKESVKQVEEGSVLVHRAGSTMEEVVHSVNKVTDIVNEISVASKEQHNGIEQVNIAVSQMDEVTQQNAALVEEASAAAGSMATQSVSLKELVTKFRLV
ncbi:methyl-accepting chemotaxis protein [Robbsia andropogonis]|uniref:methyl-accepting chemotaxis protein n=1 Tax=Robbsia andropogonis TaxID=28092 RepID=UPI0020A1F3B4|nr:methyl-accepting chemotaxis protein [Robbsia andropogonis]MCP1118560.1 methyl-accepting chemotaxis protein [Robbsia andropogonis]MCP1128027.1 methyl-accepting chemotaxis protein [Robbsia andropogonis]